MSKRRYDFREFLSDVFAKQYDGLDDEMPDAESEWLADLDIEEMIDYAEQWHKKCMENNEK